MQQGNIIGEVQKNSLEKVIVSVNRFNGRFYLDGRIWFRKVPTDHEWLPTKKGFSIAIERAHELAALIARAGNFSEGGADER